MGDILGVDYMIFQTRPVSPFIDDSSERFLWAFFLYLHAEHVCPPIFSTGIGQYNISRVVDKCTVTPEEKDCNFVYTPYLLTYLLHGAESFLRS